MKKDRQKLLKKLRKKFKKVDLVVIRRTANTYKLTNSKPCSECTKILKLFGFNKVYYTTGIGNEIKCEKISNMCNKRMSRMDIYRKKNK